MPWWMPSQSTTNDSRSYDFGSFMVFHGGVPVIASEATMVYPAGPRVYAMGVLRTAFRCRWSPGGG
ncbi:hypothetical protein GCM10023196_079220 [Actinoallomurus vinaceus]|uniref:Uncharacterized protein n=1 Tax=Actinoallomurus vinaceus TaxID=1080074 RepID=A0ABP8UMI5_9ACTN